MMPMTPSNETQAERFQLIDMREIAQARQAQLRGRIATALHAGQRRPGLAMIMVGNHPASEVYVRNKRQTCDALGMNAFFYPVPADARESTLLALIECLNEDEGVDGIIIQQPLPAVIRPEVVFGAIAPHKDVDGLHPENMGRLAMGLPGLRPCTPQGVMNLLEEIGFTPEQRMAAVIGFGDGVGKQLSLMLTGAGATTMFCPHYHDDLAPLCQQADLLIVAAGVAGLITGEMVKAGAIVLDLGIHYLPDGDTMGDVHLPSVAMKASAATAPVGVEDLAVTSLLENTWRAYQEHTLPQVMIHH